MSSAFKPKKSKLSSGSMPKMIYNVRGAAGDYSNKLNEVYSAIQNEATLLHPTLASITASYRNGKAVLMVDQEIDRVVGYVRLTELVNPNLKNKLGLSANFPNIEEIGTAIILNDPLYRNKGYYPGLRNA